MPDRARSGALGLRSSRRAEGVAKATGADVWGVKSNDPAATYRGDVEDLAPTKKWYQFWKKPNHWGPGMMADGASRSYPLA